MDRQLKGIALILIGIQLTLVCIIDPWGPLIGDAGRAALPLLAAAASVWGLLWVFSGKKDS